MGSSVGTQISFPLIRSLSHENEGMHDVVDAADQFDRDVRKDVRGQRPYRLTNPHGFSSRML